MGIPNTRIYQQLTQQLYNLQQQLLEMQNTQLAIEQEMMFRGASPIQLRHARCCYLLNEKNVTLQIAQYNLAIEREEKVEKIWEEILAKVRQRKKMLARKGKTETKL
jgi:hypothetical protein